MEQHEIWKPVPDAPGYEASNLGRVKGPRGILKPSSLNSGYLGVKVAGKGTTVHAVVATTFIGARPTSAHTVNHKNGDKQHNTPSNLEWMTQLENNRHSVEVLGIIPRRYRKPRQEDMRQPFTMSLRSAGFCDLRIEPRRGYVAWRAIDAATGEVMHCAALGFFFRDVPPDFSLHRAG